MSGGRGGLLPALQLPEPQPTACEAGRRWGRGSAGSQRDRSTLSWRSAARRAVVPPAHWRATSAHLHLHPAGRCRMQRTEGKAIVQLAGSPAPCWHRLRLNYVSHWQETGPVCLCAAEQGSRQRRQRRRCGSSRWFSELTQTGSFDFLLLFFILFFFTVTLASQVRAPHTQESQHVACEGGTPPE